MTVERMATATPSTAASVLIDQWRRFLSRVTALSVGARHVHAASAASAAAAGAEGGEERSTHASR